MRVSVIVPVHNTGRPLERCVRSLVEQSLSRTDYEVLLVDDGSDDGTEDRVLALAARHDVVLALRIPNSGWPGRPRNVGLEAARGEYVFFVDHDDWLGTEALARLTSYADDNRSDVVVGRTVGHGRLAPVQLFDRNRPEATLEQDPLLTLLTPHKLFRRRLLLDHGIRFPEGPRPLEDHLFVLAAYFAAGRISVLADYPCYHWLWHGANSSGRRVDPEAYAGSLRAILDLVEAHTEPGPGRDALVRHWYRGKMLKRLTGEAILTAPPEHRAALFAALRAVAVERVAPGVDTGLGPFYRVAAALLRADRLDLMVSLAGTVTSHRRVLLRLTGSAPAGAGADLAFETVLVEGTGRASTFAVSGDTATWVLPPDLAASSDLPATARTSAAGLPGVSARLAVVSTDSEVRYLLPGPAALVAGPDGEQVVRLRGTGRLEPATAAAGRPLEAGRWRVVARISGFGPPVWSAPAGIVTVADGRVSVDRAPGRAVAARARLVRLRVRARRGTKTVLSRAEQVPWLRPTTRRARSAGHWVRRRRWR